MPNRIRSNVWIGSLALVASLYASLFGAQTIYYLKALYLGRMIPLVKKTPIALTDLSISTGAGARLSYFGYEFEVPWDDMDDQHTRQLVKLGQTEVIVFRSGKSIWFSTSSPNKLVNQLKEMSKLDQQTFSQMYGDVAHSDYALARATLEMTPNKISPFGTRRKAVAGLILLISKAMAPSGLESGVFSIQTKDFQGFQYGSPQKGPETITVDLYSESSDLAFLFHEKDKNPLSKISQANINNVIQSLRLAKER